METDAPPRNGKPLVLQILPHVDAILKISEMTTEIGEQFADLIDEEVAEGKLTVAEANLRIQDMIALQSDIAKIDEYCRIVQNVYRTRDLLAKEIAILEHKMSELESTTLSLPDTNPQLEKRLEEARQQALLDAAKYSRARQSSIRSDEPKKNRRSRSLGKLIKEAVKKARRSISTHIRHKNTLFE